MSAEWPGLLWTLLLVPVALAAYLLAQRRRSRYTVRFTNLDLLANVVSAEPGWRRHVPPAFYLLALAACCSAWPGPRRWPWSQGAGHGRPGHGRPGR